MYQLKTQTQADGTKAITLDDIRGWRVAGSGNDSTSDLHAAALYREVALLHQCVNIRARTLMNLPGDVYRIGADDPLPQRERRAIRGILDGIRTRMYQHEASLCVYGASYELLSSNAFGRNPTLQWLVPSSITPVVDYATGAITYFNRASSVKTEAPVQLVPGEDILYYWLPSIETEVGHGTPPVKVAATAARVLYDAEAFAASYFQRGGMRMTLLTVDGNPPREELDRLQAWWRRLVSGVRRAWESIAVSSAVKPVVIGDSVSEAVSPELNAQFEEDILIAMGVPRSMLYSDAANYATAQQDVRTFYNSTVLPQANLIASTLNAQLLNDLNLEWRWHPERLEVFQQAEFEKAQSLAALVPIGVVTRNEARQALGLEPLPELDAPVQPDENATRSIKATADDLAGLDAQEQAAYLVIEPVFARYRTQPFDGAAFETDLRGALLQVMRDAAQAYMEDELADVMQGIPDEQQALLRLEIDEALQRTAATDAALMRGTTEEVLAQEAAMKLSAEWLYAAKRIRGVVQTAVARGKYAPVQAVSRTLNAVGVEVDELWVTRDDDKVRPTHAQRHLTTRSSGAWGNIVPGQEPRCRCVARIVKREVPRAE